MLQERTANLAQEEAKIQEEIEQEEILLKMYLERVVYEDEVEEVFNLRHERMRRLAIGSQEKSSRYVPVKVQKFLQKKYGDRCTAPGCGRRAEDIHHLQTFTRGGLHSPENLRPVCRGHHQLEHRSR